MTSLLYAIGEMLIPRPLKSKLRQYVVKTGHIEVHYELYALLFILDLCISAFLTFRYILPYLGGLALILLPLVVIVICLLSVALVAMYYEVKLFRRTDQIEKVLPDFLEAVSVNLRAGMTFDKALWNSIEPEYDVLAREIEIVAKKVMTGSDTEEALLDFASKYNSPLLKESMDLIIVGLRSGGEISDLIDRVVENVKQASFLKKELVANIMSYVIFITMISLFIAPTLYALSYNLMLIIQDLGAKLASSAGESVVKGLEGFGSQAIDKQSFINYSQWCIGIIAVTTSIIIADLREGSIKGSVKYVFAFIGISLIVYRVMLFVFTMVFGGMVQ